MNAEGMETNAQRIALENYRGSNSRHQSDGLLRGKPPAVGPKAWQMPVGSFGSRGVHQRHETQLTAGAITTGGAMSGAGAGVGLGSATNGVGAGAMATGAGIASVVDVVGR